MEIEEEKIEIEEPENDISEIDEDLDLTFTSNRIPKSRKATNRMQSSFDVYSQLEELFDKYPEVASSPIFLQELIDDTQVNYDDFKKLQAMPGSEEISIAIGDIADEYTGSDIIQQLVNAVKKWNKQSSISRVAHGESVEDYAEGLKELSTEELVGERDEMEEKGDALEAEILSRKNAKRTISAKQIQDKAITSARIRRSPIVSRRIRAFDFSEPRDMKDFWGFDPDYKSINDITDFVEQFPDSQAVADEIVDAKGEISYDLVSNYGELGSFLQDLKTYVEDEYGPYSFDDDIVSAMYPLTSRFASRQARRKRSNHEKIVDSNDNTWVAKPHTDGFFWVEGIDNEGYHLTQGLVPSNTAEDAINHMISLQKKSKQRSSKMLRKASVPNIEELWGVNPNLITDLTDFVSQYDGAQNIADDLIANNGDLTDDIVDDYGDLGVFMYDLKEHSDAEYGEGAFESDILDVLWPLSSKRASRKASNTFDRVYNHEFFGGNFNESKRIAEGYDMIIDQVTPEDLQVLAQYDEITPELDALLDDVENKYDEYIASYVSEFILDDANEKYRQASRNAGMQRNANKVYDILMQAVGDALEASAEETSADDAWRFFNDTLNEVVERYGYDN